MVSRLPWVMAVVVALGVSFAIGWGLLRLFRVDRSALGWVGRWSCGWLLGAYATSLCLFLLSLAGVAVSPVGPVIVAVSVVAAGVAVERPRLPRRPDLGRFLPPRRLFELVC